jgi:hypothetical protein
VFVTEDGASREQDRDDVELDLVDEPRGQVLIDHLGATAPPTSLLQAARLACSSVDSNPSVTKVNVVSDRVSGSRW